MNSITFNVDLKLRTATNNVPITLWTCIPLSTEVKLRPSDGGVLCPEVRRTPYISTCRGGNDLKLQSSEVALFGAQALHRTISPSPKPCGLARGELGY